jgi:hypothetical protein
MSEWTKEPWRLCGGCTAQYSAIYSDEEGKYVLLGHPTPSPSDQVQVFMTREDKKRAVACVNACAGMSDPAAEIAALKAENDRLRKANRHLETEVGAWRRKWLRRYA